MAWTCANCGTKNEGGLFNFCKKCGTTPSREPSAARPAGRSARPEPSRQPHVVQSTWTQGGPRRRKQGSNAFVVVLLLVLVAAGIVVAVASRVDVDEVLHDLTATDETSTAAATDDAGAAIPDFTDDPLIQSLLELGSTATEPPGESTAPPEESEPPVTTAPAVSPTLEALRQRDARCANRWNGKQNARARRAIVTAGAGATQYAGVQLTGGNAGSVQPGVCVIIFGTQPEPSEPRIRPGDVYAEAGLASGPRLPFARLGSVQLSYQWNARVARDGRILPKSAP